METVHVAGQHGGCSFSPDFSFFPFSGASPRHSRQDGPLVLGAEHALSLKHRASSTDTMFPLVIFCSGIAPPFSRVHPVSFRSARRSAHLAARGLHFGAHGAKGCRKACVDRHGHEHGHRHEWEESGSRARYSCQQEGHFSALIRRRKARAKENKSQVGGEGCHCRAYVAAPCK